MTNKLIHTTSPYLIQHAHNPVDWYPWGEEALARALAEDKPIFLSIGYAACHWCHVMAHESFEDPQTAELLNLDFISIKVDREERPDLDSIYMNAVVAMTGQGGWPMSVFLTPDLVPFYGGTYFPSQPRYGMPSFHDVLRKLASLWHNDRQQVFNASEKLAEALTHQTASDTSIIPFTKEVLTKAVSNLTHSYDWTYGGWGKAPKFPQTMALEFLLKSHASCDEDTLQLVTHALTAMARGGMNDVVGGGFARYSTDVAWLVPHFEKMLYDNALLSQVYLHAWQVSGNPRFREVVEQTLDFIIRELHSPEGGFYASLDADSEGIEGKFYVWTLSEIRAALGGRDDLFEAAYGITPAGNWEGKLILQRVMNNAELVNQFSLSSDAINSHLALQHQRLLAVRNERVRPATDDKVLTAWNGWMLSSFAEAARVLQNDAYLKIAQDNANFLLTQLIVDGRLHRAWRKGQVSGAVFLEDYAALIIGLLDLYQADFDPRWYTAANELTQKMGEMFNDPAGGFFDTSENAEKLLLRPKELQDNATPSGNALATEALLKMAAFSGNQHWRELAEHTLTLVAEQAGAHPTGFGRWLSAGIIALNPTQQITIVGDLSSDALKAFLREINRSYRPFTIMAATSLPLPPDAPPLLAERPMIDGKPTIYICEGFVCQQPITTLEGLRQQLAR